MYLSFLNDDSFARMLKKICRFNGLVSMKPSILLHEKDCNFALSSDSFPFQLFTKKEREIQKSLKAQITQDS